MKITSYLEEIKANNLFKTIVDRFIRDYAKEDGFKYLALRKKGNKFFIELSYNHKMNQKKVHEIIKYIDTNLNSALSVTTLKYFAIQSSRKKRINKHKKKLKVKTKLSDVDFSFFHGKKISGNSIRRPEHNETPGTIGGIIELENHKGLYLMSNYHVIMRDSGKLDSSVFNDDGIAIGKLFWGKFDDKFDIALAKITTSKPPKRGVHDFKFGKLTPPSYSKINLTSFSAGGSDTGEIYSINSIVKIGANVFKNQILFKKSRLEPGDSGTLIVSGNKKVRDVVGLFIGGENVSSDNSIKIANNLFNLFSNTVEEFKDHKDRIMPKIKFKTFY
ncbi:hypothetical protein [Kordia sp.]|uniref:hypothetical protein n=1 Tax=Kordia sp. TaxID=1965332 RepID=UPI003D274301